MTKDSYLGSIYMFAGVYPPAKSMFCDGAMLSIVRYEALFKLIGTRFGGDGRTTFCLPDLRGRVPQGAGYSQSAYRSRGLGQEVGAAKATVYYDIPEHGHAASFNAQNLNPSVSIEGTAKFSGPLRCKVESGSGFSPDGRVPASSTNPAQSIFSDSTDYTRSEWMGLQDGTLDGMTATASFYNEQVPVTVVEKTVGSAPEIPKGQFTVLTQDPALAIHYVIVIDSENMPPRP